MTPAPAALPPFDADQALRLARETFHIEVEALNGLAARVDGVFAQAVQMVLQARGRVVVMGMGLQDSYAGLIVPFLTSAFGIFLMRQFLLTFPDEVLDAARIDGASEPRIFASIVLPNAGPAIATLAVLTFRSQWDSLLWPLLAVQSEEMKTIPLYITKFMAETHSDEGIMMAIAAMASLPMFILFFTMSKYFISREGLYSTTKG